MSPQTQQAQKEKVDLSGILKRHSKNPKVLATRMLKAIGEPDTSVQVIDGMSSKDVVLKVGEIMAEKKLIRMKPENWSKTLFKSAEVPMMQEASKPSQAVAVTGRGRRQRVYLPIVEEALKAGNLDHKGVVDKVMAAFPNLKRVTIDTFVTDLKNEKYSAFKKDGRTVVERDKKLMFEGSNPSGRQTVRRRPGAEAAAAH